MSPDVWQVIADTMKQYKGLTLEDQHKEWIATHCDVHEFPGGAFIVKDDEIDCFVIPEKHGRWATRGLLTRVVGGVINRHGRAVCRVDRRNVKSLSFAKRLGFREVSTSGDVVKLEIQKWKL